MDLNGLIEIPSRTNHNCFGCSPCNDHGLKMSFYADRKDERVLSFIKVPSHMEGWNNLVHGGVITTLLDEIMSWTAIYELRRFILTKSISVDFIKPVIIETPLTIEGRVKERLSERSALMTGSIFSENGELLARSEGTFALFTYEAVKKLNIMDESLLADFESLLLQKV
jgi:uncharacterized protein (TIGR00369 family)